MAHSSDVETVEVSFNSIVSDGRNRIGVTTDPEITSAYSNSGYLSYSGADIMVTITMPNGEVLTMGDVQTLSYSIHRENTPVRFLGHAGPVGFVKGSRTIAGSIIFTVFNEYTFYRLQCMRDRMANTNHFGLADQLPPFDITISFSNEYNNQSVMRILGVTIVDEGGTMSIDDLLTEQTMTYIARGIHHITPSYQKDVSSDPLEPKTRGTSGRNSTKIVE